ncbi:hypothetical protein [Corynebacterium uterequi]|uniref:Uncharacterized protein n=1 Tax=Corynebacterium uterequi TaxID=1072256 RepID=A0A0G3HAC4_9CORY|nr:hypothetical protein [Corynebacterium uterequi]AKK10269.1 hypothetical protein CUTER_01245 [Corynebacterium uterequi]
MARLDITEDRVRVHLDWWEKLLMHRSHLTIPLRSVAEVQFLADTARVVEGMVFEQSTRIPGVTVSGVTREAGGRRSFVVSHRGQPGIEIQLRSVTFDRIIVSSSAADEYVRELERRITT